MTLTERLRLEVFLREQHLKHGDDFYQELYIILDKMIEDVPAINPRTRLVLYK